MVQAEFSSVKCLLLSPSPVNGRCRMHFDEFKNHLRIRKYFLLEGNLDQRSNLCNIQSLIFVNLQQSHMPSALQDCGK